MKLQHTSRANMATYNVISNGVTVKTTVTNRASFIDRYITELVLSCNYDPSHPPMIGLSVEFTHADVSQEAKAATLTLCSESRCIIIQLMYMDTNAIPGSLISFLSAPLFHFAGCGIFKSLSILRKDYGLVFRNVVELEPLFTFYLLMAMVDQVELESKPLSVIMGNWGARNLSMGQIEAAACDAHCFFMLGKRFF